MVWFSVQDTLDDLTSLHIKHIYYYLTQLWKNSISHHICTRLISQLLSFIANSGATCVKKSSIWHKQGCLKRTVFLFILLYPRFNT